MATAGPQQSEVGLKERFFRYFQREVIALEEQMERLNNTSFTGGERKDAVDHCLAGIERMSNEVKDASGYIPAYDQRTYGEAIKALNEKLQGIRNTFSPPKKFQFKTVRKNPSTSATSPSDAAELVQQNKLSVLRHQSDTSISTSFAPTPLDKLFLTEEKTDQDLLVKKNFHGTNQEDEDAPDIRKPSFSNASSVTISNHNDLHIIPPILSHTPLAQEPSQTFVTAS